MGVGNRIDTSKEAKDEIENAYRQLTELLDESDEPVASGSKGASSKPRSKVGMRPEVKKGSKSQIGDSRVYSYDELIEYRPKGGDSDDDSFRFNAQDTEVEF